MRTLRKVLLFLFSLSATGFLPLCGAQPVYAGDTIKTAGDILQFALPASGAGLAIVNDDKDGGIELAQSLGATLGVTYSLKYTVHERRPNGGEHSFPSGHTAVSAASAEFMRERYGWEYGVPAYLLTGFVGYSRVESYEHHAGDCWAGAGIGALASYLLTTPYQGITVEPAVTRNMIGFSIEKTF